MKNYCILDMDIGQLTVAEEDGKITEVYFGAPKDDGVLNNNTPALREAVKQLVEYFFCGRREFDLPIEPKGTEFQKRVWEELRKIPYGETRTYRQIAEAIGNPGAARAVGMANNKNPISIITPCHRVVNADGKIGGYAGGAEVKRFLLALEAGLLVD